MNERRITNAKTGGQKGAKLMYVPIIIDGRKVAEAVRRVARDRINRKERRITNAKTGGQKGAKPEAMALLPWDALLEVSKVYGYGAEKYEANNWRKGYDWSLSMSALQRHLAAFWCGEDDDPESGLPHLAHAAFHVLALLVFSQNARYADLDDRPTIR